MVVEGHTVKQQGSECQVYFSPKGMYYYVYKSTMDGAKYPNPIKYNKERKG